jgi:hypothetical protein
VWAFTEKKCEEKMTKFWKSLLVSPAVFGTMLVMSASAIAGETPGNLDKEAEKIPQNKTMAQVLRYLSYRTCNPQIGHFKHCNPW